MSLNRDIRVTIQDGGLGRLPAGKDHYTGLVFYQIKPTEFGTDDIKRVYSLKGAEALGITAADYPVEHYHISEYFRILDKYDKNGLLDVGMFEKPTPLVFAEITTIQNNANGELRQIGVFLNASYAADFIEDANTVAAALDTEGYPVSIYLAADIADHSALVDLRSADKKWVSLVIGQDGGGTGAALYTSEGYSITCLGAILGITAVAEVHQRIGNMRIPFDLSGITELQTLAVCDGTLVSAIADALIDSLTDYGYTLLVYRRTPGSYVYVDAMTASDDESDYTEQRFNRVVGKAKRYLLDDYQVLQNSEIYVNPSTGKMDKRTISYIESLGLASLNKLAILGNISYDRDTGEIPRRSVQCDPDQDVLTSGKILISAKVVPVGAVDEAIISLSLTTSIS